MPPDNIREDLEKAFETAEAADPGTEAPTGGAPEGGGPAADTEESVRAAKTPQELLEDKTPLEDEKPKEKIEDEPDPKEAVAQTEDKPPAGWKPEIRESWKDLPPAVRTEITRRERAYAAGIQQYAEGARAGRQFQEVLAPYKHLMAMEGADEVQAVQHLAQQAAVMRIGTQTQKAQLVANIINAYGVDIQMLDNLLSGEDPLPQEHKPLMDALEQRLKPFESLLGEVTTAKQRALETTNQSLSQEIAAFESDPKNEFIEDVRSDMADLMELAARRGQTMTLQQAYDKACRANDSVRTAMENRTLKEKALEQRKKIEAKSAAASSLPGRGAQGGSKTPDSLRDSLLEAWDAASNG